MAWAAHICLTIRETDAVVALLTIVVCLAGTVDVTLDLIVQMEAILERLTASLVADGRETLQPIVRDARHGHVLAILSTHVWHVTGSARVVHVLLDICN